MNPEAASDEYLEVGNAAPADTATAKHPYAGGTGKLAFGAGETLTILARDGAWWTARNAAGDEGKIPSNYMA